MNLKITKLLKKRRNLYYFSIAAAIVLCNLGVCLPGNSFAAATPSAATAETAEIAPLTEPLTILSPMVASTRANVQLPKNLEQKFSFTAIQQAVSAFLKESNSKFPAALPKKANFVQVDKTFYDQVDINDSVFLLDYVVSNHIQLLIYFLVDVDVKADSFSLVPEYVYVFQNGETPVMETIPVQPVSLQDVHVFEELVIDSLFNIFNRIQNLDTNSNGGNNE